MDGDDSYSALGIPKLVRFLQKENLDFISCNRLPFRDKKSMSSIRLLRIKILNLMIWLLYGFRIRDSLSGMWVFHKKALKNRIFKEGGWNFSLEIKLNAINSSKNNFAEFPIVYHDRLFDLSKQTIFKTGIEHFFFLLIKKLNPA